MQQQLFPIERTLDFTLKQGFLVLANSAEEAAEQVNRFANESNWTDEAAYQLGVVQVSDELEQTDNSEEILPGPAPVAMADAKVDASLHELLLKARSDDMLAMLRKIAAAPQMYTTGISDLGLEVKALVENIDADLASPDAILKRLISENAGSAQDPDAEILPGAVRAEIGEVLMSDVIGDYDTPDGVPEWAWVERNASFAHVKNGEAGIWEFVLNLGLTWEDIPAKLAPVIAQARKDGKAYLIFHQGT